MAASTIMMAGPGLYSTLTALHCRHSASGDHLSVTPDSPGRRGHLPSKSAPHSRSAIEVAVNGTGSDQRSTSSGNSNTLPIRKHRSKQTSEERSKKKTKRDSADVWEIPYQEIKIEKEKIGSGSFGIVFKGQWHGPVAVKKLTTPNLTEQQLFAFKNEVDMLSKTRHANILLFMGWTALPELSIVTQFCDGSTLYQHLHVMKTEFGMYQLIDMGRQTAQGVNYLHSKNIVHRDLKSNNIFLHDDCTVKIGDFGLAMVKARWEDGQKMRQATGTILWMAPEVIRMSEPDPYTFYCDVYSFGVVLYELITSQLPYADIKNPHTIMYMVGSGILQLELNNAREDTPKACKQLLTQCCQYEAKDRPLFPQILVDLETLVDQLPKIKRSSSESHSLHDNYYTLNDSYSRSPHTPIHSHDVQKSLDTFIFE